VQFSPDAGTSRRKSNSLNTASARPQVSSAGNASRMRAPAIGIYQPST
jgi:hypothetical protein